jgi:hypothetical protein
MSTNDNAPSIPQADIWAALQRQSNTRSRPEQLPYSSFPNGQVDVVDLSGPDPSGNLYHLHCPRSECGSCILKKGTAAFVERESVQVGFVANCSVGLITNSVSYSSNLMTSFPILHWLLCPIHQKLQIGGL